jgi:hypothetical protein
MHYRDGNIGPRQTTKVLAAVCQELTFSRSIKSVNLVASCIVFLFLFFLFVLAIFRERLGKNGSIATI